VNWVTCIGCGCDEARPCVSEGSPPYSWVRIERDAGFGVCSSCPTFVDRWDGQEQERAQAEHGPLILPGDDEYGDTLTAMRSLQ